MALYNLSELFGGKSVSTISSDPALEAYMRMESNARRRQADEHALTAAVAPVRTAPERPVPKQAHRLIPADKQEAYEQLAEIVGYRPAELLRVKLLAFFEDEGYELYDEEKVGAWMTHKTPKGKNWFWRPLRGKDRPDYSTQTIGQLMAMGDSFSPYDKIIPAHALAKVAKIENRFPEQVAFFVTDYADVRPDPFISVTPKGGGFRLIFDMWDEPGFGEFNPEDLKK